MEQRNRGGILDTLTRPRSKTTPPTIQHNTAKDHISPPSHRSAEVEIVDPTRSYSCRFGAEDLAGRFSPSPRRRGLEADPSQPGREFSAIGLGRGLEALALHRREPNGHRSIAERPHPRGPAHLDALSFAHGARSTGYREPAIDRYGNNAGVVTVTRSAGAVEARGYITA
jgi:hypothetical protein